jgi:hypothetical protein
MYKDKTKRKVPYFIPAERIPALSWRAWVQVVHIFTTRQQLTATTSSDVNRNSSSFKMATVLKKWTKEEVRSVIRFYL